MQHLPGPCPLQEVVDILGDQNGAEPRLPVREGLMHEVRLDLVKPGAPGVVEGMDLLPVRLPCLKIADLIKTVVLPQSIGSPKGRDPAVCGKACAREDNEAFGLRYGVGPWLSGSFAGIHGDREGQTARLAAA